MAIEPSPNNLEGPTPRPDALSFLQTLKIELDVSLQFDNFRD